MKDLSFYFQMALLILEHARPDAIKKAWPAIRELRDFLNTIPDPTA